MGATGSRASCIELFLDVLEPGVAGPDPWWKGGSEFCRSLWDRPKRSPKLFLPVEVEVRVEGSVGVGKESSVGMFLKERKVDDLPLGPSLARLGDDFVDAAEPCRNRGTPGAAANAVEAFARAACEWFGDGSGDAKRP